MYEHSFADKDPFDGRVSLICTSVFNGNRIEEYHEGKYIKMKENTCVEYSDQNILYKADSTIISQKKYQIPLTLRPVEEKKFDSPGLQIQMDYEIFITPDNQILNYNKKCMAMDQALSGSIEKVMLTEPGSITAYRWTNKLEKEFKNTRDYEKLPGITVKTKDMFDKIIKSIRSWNKDGVYVISFFCHEGIASLTYNTEEQVKSQMKWTTLEEARWNYAYWKQDIKLNFSVEGINDIAKVLKQSGFIEKEFGKTIPVLVHSLEYSEKTIQINRKINGEDLPEEFIAFCRWKP